MSMQAVDVFSDAEVLIAIPTRNESDVVYLTGSRTAGFGHAASDYDAFVVTTPPIPRQFERGLMTRIGNASLDVTYVLPERFEEVERALAKRGLSDIARLEWVELDFAARVVVGQPLQSRDAFVELQARFPIEQLSQAVFGWERVRALAAMLEAQLAADAGLPESAWTCGQRGIVHTACAATALHHEIHMNAKWVHEKCAKVGSNEPRLLDDLLGLESAALPTSAETDDFLSRCRDFVSRFADVDAAAFVRAEVSDASILVGSTFLLESAPHAYLVKNGWRTYRVDHGVSDLWEQLNRGSMTIRSLQAGDGDRVLRLEREGLVQFDWIGLAVDALAGGSP